MGDDGYAQGFFEAITPQWEAFTFNDGKLVAIFCHIFGARVQLTYLTENLEEASVALWRSIQSEAIQRCASVIARGL